MKLYHGTTAGLLLAVLRDGIKPRGRRKSNWKHSVESNPRAVYLTDAYPAHFAVNAAKKGLGLVLEVDTDKLDRRWLAPDEDVMEQALRGRDGVAGDMVARTRHYRDRIGALVRTNALNQSAWTQSLKGLGTCAYYDTVPPDAVTGYATIAFGEVDRALLYDLVDTSVSLMNYHVLAPRHRNLSRWIMGAHMAAADLDPMTQGHTDGLMRERNERLDVALRQRAGVHAYRRVDGDFRLLDDGY